MIALKEVNDGVFSAGIMGEGFAIILENETIYAPADATVSLLMQESRHACGLKLANGAEILLHIGIDTVAMNGDGFEYLVKEGQKVSAGTPLIKFDKKRDHNADRLRQCRSKCRPGSSHVKSSHKQIVKGNVSRAPG